MPCTYPYKVSQKAGTLCIFPYFYLCLQKMIPDERETCRKEPRRAACCGRGHRAAPFCGFADGKICPSVLTIKKTGEQLSGPPNAGHPDRKKPRERALELLPTASFLLRPEQFLIFKASHRKNGFRNQIVQAPAQHFRSLLDHIPGAARREPLILKLLLHGFQLQILYAL